VPASNGPSRKGSSRLVFVLDSFSVHKYIPPVCSVCDGQCAEYVINESGGQGLVSEAV